APGVGLVLARAAGLVELILWAGPGLLLVACWGGLRSVRRAGDRRLSLLALSAACTLAGYMFVPFNQGHGWGFRYFHSAWGAVPLLAAAFLTSPDVEKTFLPRVMLVCAVLSLALGTGLRFAQVRSFIDDHLAQLPRAAASPKCFTSNAPCGPHESNCSRGTRPVERRSDMNASLVMRLRNPPRRPPEAGWWTMPRPPLRSTRRNSPA